MHGISWFDEKSGAGMLIAKMSKEVVLGTLLLHIFICMQDMNVRTTYLLHSLKWCYLNENKLSLYWKLVFANDT